MCSDFMKRMDNYQGGDLTDILRTGGGGGSSASTDGGGGTATPEWQFTSNPITYPADPVEDFGDPFAHLRDPLLHDIDTPVSAGFFPSVTSSSCINQESTGTTTTTVGFAAAADGNTSILAHRRPAADNVIETRSRPSNMFSRMLQISPNAKLAVVQPSDSMGMGMKGPNPMLMPGNSINTSHVMIPPNSSKVGNCLVESPAGLQISSPRNTGIKRRKSQAKKVVCIPAPAPANSRPSAGEIVPSDLWAWRKYGQKPIKGSPYPRGYYRCSSSKGCSARKQVERSRTDPNMLVITYTSEHNHPWPTQRNALAGSTRSQPSKSSASKTSPNSSQSLKSTNPKEEQKDHHTTTTGNDPDPSSRADAGNNPTVVKEENMDDQDFDNQLEMDNHGDPELNDQAGFPQSYRPTLPDTNQEDSFFADLGEIEADSLDMLFTQGFGGEDVRGNKISGLDQFSFYDWAVNNGNNTSTTTTTSFGEAKKDSLYDDHDKNCKNPR